MWSACGKRGWRSGSISNWLQTRLMIKRSSARLENLPTLHMSTAKLIEEYPQPKQAEKAAAKHVEVAANAIGNPRTAVLKRRRKIWRPRICKLRMAADKQQKRLGPAKLFGRGGSIGTKQFGPSKRSRQIQRTRAMKTKPASKIPRSPGNLTTRAEEKEMF